MTNGDILKAHATRLGLRTEATRKTLIEVQSTLAECKKRKSDASMARLFINHGWVTDEARNWLSQEYPQR